MHAPSRDKDRVTRHRRWCVHGWPGARYMIVPDAGHSVWERSVRSTVVREAERFKQRLGRAGARGVGLSAYR